MKAIACVTKNKGLGYKGNLLVKSKVDMKFFRETTLGKVIVMGRKTFESMNCKPLKDRTNVVISSRYIDNKEIVQFYDLESFLKSKYNNDNTFVIGGGQIYIGLLPYVDTVLLTEVGIEKEADTFFPDITNDFEKVSCNVVLDNDLELNFCEYKRKD